MINVARYLIIFGILMMLVGGIFYLAAKSGISLNNIPIGKLPGDFRIEGKNITCLIPLASSLLISLILTIILNLIIRLLGR